MYCVFKQIRFADSFSSVPLSGACFYQGKKKLCGGILTACQFISLVFDDEGI